MNLKTVLTNKIVTEKKNSEMPVQQSDENLNQSGKKNPDQDRSVKPITDMMDDILLAPLVTVQKQG